MIVFYSIKVKKIILLFRCIICCSVPFSIFTMHWYLTCKWNQKTSSISSWGFYKDYIIACFWLPYNWDIKDRRSGRTPCFKLIFDGSITNNSTASGFAIRVEDERPVLAFACCHALLEKQQFLLRKRCLWGITWLLLVSIRD